VVWLRDRVESWSDCEGGAAAPHSKMIALVVLMRERDSSKPAPFEN
jgi:hypothetical protein